MSKINTKIWLMCCDLLHKNFMHAYFGKELPLGVDTQQATRTHIKYSKICFCPLLKLMDSCIYIMFYTKCIILLFYCWLRTMRIWTTQHDNASQRTQHTYTIWKITFFSHFSQISGPLARKNISHSHHNYYDWPRISAEFMFYNYFNIFFVVLKGKETALTFFVNSCFK